jgi:hypothetical protein
MALRFTLRKRAIMANVTVYVTDFAVIQSYVLKALCRMTVRALTEHGGMIIRHRMTLDTTPANIFVVNHHINLPTGIVKMTAAAV